MIPFFLFAWFKFLVIYFPAALCEKGESSFRILYMNRGGYHIDCQCLPNRVVVWESR